MTNPDSATRRVAFDSFVLDFTQRILEKDGRLLRLSPMVVETLMALVENRGRVVTKEELVARLWPDTIVEESGLQRNISLLRKALQENGAPELIETVPKRGYRFTGELREPEPEIPIEPVTAAEPALVAEVRPRSRAWKAWLGGVVVLVVGVGIYLGRGPAPAPATGAGQASSPGELSGKLSQITSNSVELSVVSAAISPDGKWLAYDERGSLRLRNVATGEVGDLPGPPHIQPTYLTWSASSEDLLLCGINLQTRGGELWRVPISGGLPVKLVDDATMSTASPDGRRIAFSRGEYELWIIAPDGSGAELFLEAPPDRRLLFRPAFSRDGKRLYLPLFHRGSLALQLAVYDIDSKRQIFVGELGRVLDLTLLDDRTLLAAMSSDGDVVRSAYLATLSIDFERQRITETQRSPEWPHFRAYELSATTDGRAAAFVRDQVQSDIYVGDLSADGGTLSRVRRLTLDDGSERLTAWLPDNRTVLFHAVRDNVGIWQQAIDAPRATRLPADGRHNLLPVSTHDGRWLFYMSFAAGRFPGPGHPQTLMRQRQGDKSPPQALLASEDALAAVNCARRAPRCVFIEGKDGRTTFSELDVEAGSLKKLFTLPMQLEMGFNWAVSPDGKSVAYVERASEGMRVGVRDLESSGSMRVSLPVEGSGHLRSVAWDATGEGVFVVQCLGEAGMLLHLDLKSRARVLRTFHTSCDGWAIPSPDGKHLAFIEATSTANLWMWQR